MRRRYGKFLPTAITEDDSGRQAARFGRFEHFSGLVESEACGLGKRFGKCIHFAFHQNYSWRRKRDQLWLRRVVFVPIGKPDTRFVFGFYLPGLGAMTFSSVIRRVSDGPFAMLDWSAQSFFYAIGDAPIELRLEKHILAGSKEEDELLIDLY
ncbi:hypothetical protein HGA34_05855 [Candidatus Falkowbacteria bacterium]|nr:hypothetical protein [Candidatus Falkowbacteria bacterium]